MKTRTGFVSNSSSSSFILSIDKDAPRTTRIEAPIPGDVIKTEAKLKKYFEDQWGWEIKDAGGWEQFLVGEKHESTASNYQEALRELQKGRVLLVGDVGSENDSPIDQLLYATGFEGSIDPNTTKILQDA